MKILANDHKRGRRSKTRGNHSFYAWVFLINLLISQTSNSHIPCITKFHKTDNYSTAVKWQQWCSFDENELFQSRMHNVMAQREPCPQTLLLLQPLPPPLLPAAWLLHPVRQVLGRGLKINQQCSKCAATSQRIRTTQVLQNIKVSKYYNLWSAIIRVKSL